MNNVHGGDYRGGVVLITFTKGAYIQIKGQKIMLNRDTVAEYEIIDTNEQISAKKKGGITRGIVGGALFGVPGAIIGTSTAKTKVKSKKSYLVNVWSVDGKHSVLQLDESTFKIFIGYV